MKAYKKPVLNVEHFVANEFVSACTNEVYKFTCDAGGGEIGDVFTKDGENLTKNSWVTNYFHACNTTHEASTKDEFIEGSLVLNDGNDKKSTYVGFWPFGHYEGYETIPVLIWTDGGTDVHCTTNLKMETWTTAKS